MYKERDKEKRIRGRNMGIVGRRLGYCAFFGKWEGEIENTKSHVIKAAFYSCKATTPVWLAIMWSTLL